MDSDPLSEHFAVLSMTKRKGGEIMDSRDLIIEADRIRSGLDMTQAEWSAAAGLDVDGSTVCRIYRRGSCQLSTMVRLLRPLGYELKIMKVEDMP